MMVLIIFGLLLLFILVILLVSNLDIFGVLGGAGGGMLGDGSTNINVLGATAGSGSGAPTAFQAWEKSCEDTLALQGGLYQWALTQQNQRFEDRERLNSELFGVYIDGRNRTDALIEKNNTDHFNLYKYTRDADDDIRKELSDFYLSKF